MRKRSTKACDISPAVRREVYNRDGGRCVICGRTDVQTAHYISRARLGLGIPENLALLCVSCHAEYDNGKLHHQIKNALKVYLQAKYEHWDENKLIYRKDDTYD